MLEKIALRIFLTSAALCGSVLLFAIWSGWEDEKFFRFAPTFFIIGFFSFLVWATRIAYRFLQAFEK